MATKSRTARWAGLEATANRQFGVIARGQLRGHGVSDSAIKHAISTGRLHFVFRGVFALGRAPVERRGRLFAATLACGEGAVVSHRTAAASMGLLDRAPVAIDVIAPAGRGRGIDGIRRHGVRRPTPREVGTFAGVPCTSPARTLVDVAGEVGVRTLRSCFERAAAKGLLDLDAVDASLRPRSRGASSLRVLLGEWRPALAASATPRLKSPLEAMVLPLLAGRGLPAPHCNAPVALADGRRIEVDFLWEKQRFVLEADSRDFHGTEAAFERDRWRDRELMRVGYGSLRITKRQAERETEAVVAAIAARVKRRPSE
jgi:hypothetical protein